MLLCQGEEQCGVQGVILSGLWFRPMEALRFSGEALGLLSRLKGHWVP